MWHFITDFSPFLQSPFRNIVFEDVITNIGDAYSSESGMFVAPLNGTYVVTVTVAAELTSTNTTTFYMFINAAGKNVARLVGHNRQQSTQTVIVELNAGEAVFLMNSQVEYTVLGSLYTSMSGFLLSSME